MTDYERIARVIRYLDGCRRERQEAGAPPPWSGLSALDIQQLVSGWAAITPEDFLQYLTVEHAKECLRRGAGALDAAQASAPSGPIGRGNLLFDLEAASTAEWRSGGVGWTITAGWADSPFGRCLVAESDRGVCWLAFADSEAGRVEWGALRRAWPRARLLRDDARAGELGRRIFRPSRCIPSRPPLRAWAQGTEFQVRVWRRLLDVPSGAWVSYGRLAAAVGQPEGARAVGGAVGRNPIAYLIPCHRVVREDGQAGGYRWGAVRKRAMLVWESGGSEFKS